MNNISLKNTLSIIFFSSNVILKKFYVIICHKCFDVQLQDIQYLTENIWASQSVLSAWKDLNDLVMVRWDKSLEWSPWNCILLTKDEGATHLKLKSIEEVKKSNFIGELNLIIGIIREKLTAFYSIPRVIYMLMLDWETWHMITVAKYMDGM